MSTKKKDKEEGDPDQPLPEGQAQGDQPSEQQGDQPSEQPSEQQGESSGEGGEAREPMTAYEPKHRPLENAGTDHHAVEAGRENERQLQREEHNRRVGDASRR